MMKKLFILIFLVVIVTAIITIPLVTEQFTIAKSTKKVHFTQTITSSQDPGIGHQSHQLALILSPNEGTMYDGSMTYTASENVQLVVLHEISKEDVKNQPTWTVDGDSIFGLTLIEQNTNSGSLEFTGAALALHSTKSDQFTATVSVDGWIRGQPTEVLQPKIVVQKEEPSLKLLRANVNATIPMHQGLFNAESVYYIITDSNNEEFAELITKKQNWRVELAPPLSKISDDILNSVYVFKEGRKGDGIFGYQNEVFSSTPAQKEEYSALHSVIYVSWKLGQNSEVLDSVDKIQKVQEEGRLKLETTDIVVNMPQIIWPNGQMIVRVNMSLNEGTPYGGGQILEINKNETTVTFVAHRGWGPDGRTIYYIVTDATPRGPAEMMGVTNSPTLDNLITNPAAVDLFQFNNGIKSSGLLGFQAGISASALGDENYSPLSRIFMIEWKDPKEALVLETRDDINAAQSEGLIDVRIAKPMNSNHIVNSPFIDPFQ